tara:strand:- start:379 stop:549 length:171 start_codon:yes stop_codon:yes gene_type:complete
MTEEEYNKSLGDFYSEGQVTMDKYLKRAEFAQSQGLFESHDTLDLAVELFWKERKV